MGYNNLFQSKTHLSPKFKPILKIRQIFIIIRFINNSRTPPASESPLLYHSLEIGRIIHFTRIFSIHFSQFILKPR
jgi:hypothetical protein